MNDVGFGLRSYVGGAADATAFTTVVRESPSLAAIRALGTPSAASLLINAQSSTVITLQSLRVFTFRAPLRPVFKRRRDCSDSLSWFLPVIRFWRRIRIKRLEPIGWHGATYQGHVLQVVTREDFGVDHPVL